MKKGIIYLDNSATSFPKAPGVGEAVAHFLNEIGASPGRSSHSLAMGSTALIFNAREKMARLLDIGDSSRLVFTSGATLSLNMAIQGFVTSFYMKPSSDKDSGPGICRVLTSGMEHNSVMRPLRNLEERGLVVLSQFRCGQTGEPDLDDYARLLTRGQDLAVFTACSNVTGVIFPVARMVALARQSGVVTCIDAAQAIGSIPFSVSRVEAHLVAFSGHKGLLGPTGTGGLYVSDEVALHPLVMGGTGSRSDRETQPAFMPDTLESGTPNTAGIAGLSRALDYILGQGVDFLHARCLKNRDELINGLKDLPGIRIHGPGSGENASSTISFTHEELPVDLITSRLDRAGVAVRMGLHCAPGAHQTIGTFPQGTVRISPGPFTSEREITGSLEILEQIIRDPHTGSGR